jgi:hypothetical protein
MLATEILGFENSALERNPFCITDNLSKKMPITKSHENNRKQISRINSVQTTSDEPN